MTDYTHPLTGMKSCMPPVADTRTPHFKAPAGACDAHCHVFGPHEIFPYHPKSTYHPPDGPKEKLAELHAKLGIDRAVIVQASCHGPDNRAMLDAIVDLRLYFNLTFLIKTLFRLAKTLNLRNQYF